MRTLVFAVRLSTSLRGAASISSVRGGVACVALCSCLALPTQAVAARSDVSATGAYLRADYALKLAVLAHAAASVADMEKEASGIAAGCPSALVGAPHGEQFQALADEITVDELLSSAKPDKNASLGFAAKVDALRWSNRTIVGLARSVAAEERMAVTVTLPDACTDIGAWTASGYHTLPESTQHFIKATGVLGKETSSGGKSESQEEILLRRLQSYETPSDRQLSGRLNKLEKSFENKLGSAWLKAVARAAQALYPKST